MSIDTTEFTAEDTPTPLYYAHVYTILLHSDADVEVLISTNRDPISVPESEHLEKIAIPVEKRSAVDENEDTAVLYAPSMMRKWKPVGALPKRVLDEELKRAGYVDADISIDDITDGSMFTLIPVKIVVIGPEQNAPS